MPTRNINLTDHYDDFVDAQVASGRFKNASEVMRAGLRLLEQHSREDEEKLTMLRLLASEGFSELDGGQGIVFEGQEPLGEFLSRLGHCAAQKVEKQQTPDG